jgi:hypothetical protein
LLGNMVLLGRGKFGPIFNSIGDAAQQIGITDHFTESRWKHGDGQGKRAGDALKYMALISMILGSGLCHVFLFVWHDRHNLVGVTRFERATPASRRQCSTRLSYTPTV